MTTATGIVGEFFSLKEESGADILTMQCGDFYEFFGEDAEIVADELDLKLTQKSSAGTPYPMAGVPFDDLTPYLKALVERGYRVAIADQYETEDGHAREVTRIVTPGTLLETTDADARYVAAVVRVEDGFGLAFADATTGRFLVTSVDGVDAEDRMIAELYRYDPVEVLPGPDIRNDDALLERIRSGTKAAPTVHDANAFAPGAATHRTREQFGAETIASLGLDAEPRAEVRAAGAVLSYVDETGTGVLPSMTRLQAYSPDEHVSLDATTQRNLELLEPMTGDGPSLFDAIDHTVTSAGGRLLREWLSRPRQSLPVLVRRQESVAVLAEAALARETLRDVLSAGSDLERLASRATHGSAGARDLLAVRDTLSLLPDVADTIEGAPELSKSPLTAVIERPDREEAAALHEELGAALADDPPKTLTEGGLIRRGYDADLDDLVERHEEALSWIDTLPERERARLGITHLQVDRNRTDGYYVQIGRSEVDAVPEEYREIKTLKNSKRYTTDELEERERAILRLEEERGEIEYELFCDLRVQVAAQATLLQDVGRALAEVDALSSLATHAAANGWIRPDLAESGPTEIEAGRHPVVEQTTEFVPNDLRLTEDRSFLLVTGPNMSGKSTYMRQAALIVLLAQVGSFVPADRARIALVDGIYTRVGALDELAQGRSTFMVEMAELSNILHSATENSLVILDEVGRGTATYDGISIAWAATEYIHNEIRSKTLFATHYHELTGLAEHLDRVANVHVAAEERDGDVTFLRSVREGATDRSYGIHVADLAGVPVPVVERARDVLDRLREEKAIEARGSGSDGPTQVVFDLETGSYRTGASNGNSADDSADGGGEREARDGGEEGEGSPGGDPATRAVLEELAATDVEETPPVELMARVQEWQERLAAASSATRGGD